MRGWGKKRRERGNIIRETERGDKRPRVSPIVSHVDSSSTPGKVAETQREQWKNSSKPLLDGRQGKRASISRKGRLEKPARKTKQATANALPGKSQKERMVEERQRRRVTVQMQQEPKQTPTTPKEPASIEASGRLTSRLTKGVWVVAHERGRPQGTDTSVRLTSHLGKDQGVDAQGQDHPQSTDTSDRRPRRLGKDQRFDAQG